MAQGGHCQLAQGPAHPAPDAATEPGRLFASVPGTTRRKRLSKSALGLV
jgi:hypothetical protein